MTRFTAVLLVAAGCGTAATPTAVNIRTLRALTASDVQQAGVVIGVDPITTGNWKQFPQVTAHVAMEVESQTTAVSVGGATVGAAASQVTLRWDDIPIVPLPAFRLRIGNHSGHALKLDGVRAQLSDGGKTVEMVPASEVRGAVERDLIDQQQRLGRKWAPDTLRHVREAVAFLPLAGASPEIPDGGEWVGYVAFHFESEQPVERVSLALDGMKLDDAAAPPFKFPFMVEHKRAMRACKDGSVATTLGVCPGDEDETSPADDGPCVQKTRNPVSDLRKQWWIGPTAVADSDLHRTLMAQPVSHRVIQRGLVLRGVGYGTIIAGVGLSVVLAVLLGHNYGSNYGMIGLSGLGLAIPGGAMAYIGSRRTEDAVTAYNLSADQGGPCAPVW
jgi:hypothetical protein